MKEMPEKDWKDYRHDLIKAGVSTVPVAGGAMVSLFETIFSAPIDKRKKVWFEKLANTVDELCKKVDGLTPETLSNNEEFISAYLQASNIAVRTNHVAKLRYLNNAVKNTVLLTDYDESKKMVFIKVIDEMTPLHFKLLHFLSKPKLFIKELNDKQGPNTRVNWVNLSNVWDEIYTDIKSNDPLLNIIVSDLKRFGFTHISEFHNANMISNSTKTARDFLRFVEGES